VDVAGAALDAATNVIVLEVERVLNEAVTPAGRPDAVRVTLPVKPLFGVTVTILVALAPFVTLTAAGAAEIENNAGGTMVKAMAAVAVRLPDVPVTVTAAAPAVALALARKVKELVVAVTAGLNDADTPLGSPVTTRFTVPLKPRAEMTAILELAAPPCARFTAAGVAVRLKLDPAVTCRFSDAVAVTFPETPCTENA
jgi:hypothetical protein